MSAPETDELLTLGDALYGVAWDADAERDILNTLTPTAAYFEDFPWQPGEPRSAVRQAGGGDRERT